MELIQILSPDTLPTDATTRKIGIARLGFEVDDIETTVAELRERGVEFMSDIVTVTVKPGEHYSDGKAIKFQDPDGIILELQQPPAPAASRSGGAAGAEQHLVEHRLRQDGP